MNTSSRRIVAQGSSCDDESEPLNSASSSMRTRVFKRQKLRPVICMMLAGVSVVAVIAVIFMLYVGLTEQGEDLTYDGEQRAHVFPSRFTQKFLFLPKKHFFSPQEPLSE